MQTESIRILIVDDAFQRDDQIDATLAAAGFETRVVADSVSAVGALDVWHPAAAVVDLRFPASEARRFCIAVAERDAADAVPVVLLAEGTNLLKPSPIVPAGLVPTPVDASQLLASVARAIRQPVGSGSAGFTSR
jgi:DNA-binding response OmpR family regulator